MPRSHPAERFERCFERHYADVARYCARRTSTPEDAEDAATDVFATAWRRLSEMPDEPDDRLWLFGIARHVVANAVRGERRRSRLVLRLGAHAAPPPAPPPSAGSEAAALAHALAGLPAGDRELLLLVGWEGLTPAEIARVLDRPVALVSRRLYRARRRFAARLAAVGHHHHHPFSNHASDNSAPHPDDDLSPRRVPNAGQANLDDGASSRRAPNAGQANLDDGASSRRAPNTGQANLDDDPSPAASPTPVRRPRTGMN